MYVNSQELGGLARGQEAGEKRQGAEGMNPNVHS